MNVGGFHPQTVYETPHIDPLAKRGMPLPQEDAA